MSNEALGRLIENEVANLDHDALLINAFDQQHRVLYWNAAAERYFNIPRQQALGQKLEELFPWASSHDNYHLLLRALKGQRVELLQQGYAWKPGAYNQSLIPVRDGSGQVIAALNIVEELR